LFFAVPDPASPGIRGSCVMRTDNPAIPSSWRAWDGAQFSLVMTNPYTVESPVPACKIVIPTGLQGRLTYNTYLHLFMVADVAANFSSGSPDCGFYYALSPDLVKWTSMQKFMSAYLPGWVGSPPLCAAPGGNAGGVAYASLVDHDSASYNFEVADQTPYLYYTLVTSDTSFNPRNLVRRPIILLKSTTFTGDLTAPSGSLDLPVGSSVISGTQVLVAGWAYDDTAMDRVEIWVDTRFMGNATLGRPRPDLPAAIPGAPADAGYDFTLDSTQLANGPHLLMAKAIDGSGNVRTMKTNVEIRN
jgi:hypothetical protein